MTRPHRLHSFHSSFRFLIIVATNIYVILNHFEIVFKFSSKIFHRHLLMGQYMFSASTKIILISDAVVSPLNLLPTIQSSVRRGSITDFRISRRFIVGVDSALWSWGRVDVNHVADVSEVHAACIFRTPKMEAALTNMHNMQRTT
jgi:hypothetical protein